MKKSKILITAANGNIGFPAAKELLKLGFPVRAFVRNPHSTKAKALKQRGAEIFVGDIENINDVRNALDGIERAYFVPTFPNVLFQGETFATAVDELGTKHVVIVTQWLSSNNHPSIYTKEHWLVDQAFKRLTKTKLTFLNPGFFGAMYFLTPEPLAQFGMLPDFGTNAPPSSEDIGLVAAHILKDPETHEGKTYRITGKDLTTPAQMAQVIGKVIGRNVKVANLSEKMILKVLKASGYSKMDSSQIRYYIKEGPAGTWGINAPTNVVKDIVGKEADDFETITKRYLTSHPMAKQTFTNKLKAMLFMLKVVFTPAWDMDRFEREQSFPKFKETQLSSQSTEWLATHQLSNVEPKLQGSLILT